MTDVVKAISEATTNADLIVQCVQLGYLRADMRVLDPTYGMGGFWKKWTPDDLIGSDLDPDRSPWGEPVDFTDMPFRREWFDAVIFDPPYKLNGTSAHPSDDRYGVAGSAVRWQDRHRLIQRGIAECARVLKPGGVLMVKCQDQVSSGKVRWQTREFADRMEVARCELIDMLHLLSYRPQPEGRKQMHARRNYSTLLIGRKS